MFLAMSVKYPADKSVETGAGVPLMHEVSVARDIMGQVGSGVYLVDVQGESADVQMEQLLAQFWKQGLVEEVWGWMVDDFVRITGQEAV